MIREALSSGELGLYAQIAVVLFVASFVAVLAWAVCSPKAHIRHLAHLPLDDGDPDREAPR